MTQKQEYISDADLDRLENFLLERFDEDADTNGKDEGIYCLSELDGFLTAIVSGPTMIPPSQWLPVVWGDFEPVWDSEEEAQEIMLLMINIMNSTATTLMEAPDEYEPIFLEHIVKGVTHTIVDEWCEGYMRGVNLALDQWHTDGLEMKILLTPISAFTKAMNWPAHELTDIAEIENVQNAISPNAREIHAYWLARREVPKSGVTTFRNNSPSIGRNDPCPCGSGKKYKKCCLH